MKCQWQELMKELPDGDELTKKHISKIRHFLPVPSDFEIKWASIEQFGRNPCGIAVTDKGIVIKGVLAKSDAMNINDNQKKSRKKKIELPPYQIFLWDTFEPEDVAITNHNGNITVMIGDIKYSGFKNQSIVGFFDLTLRKQHEFERLVEQIISQGVIANLYTFGFEDIHFSASYGGGQSKTGYSTYGEEASAILDQVSGSGAEVVSRDNTKNAPDKIVNGKAVQCKFCKSATATVNSCFGKNPSTGNKEFRYFCLDGSPMKVEVAKDQYAKAIEVMKEKIIAGRVPGITNPDAAYEIIHKSKLSYKQVKNLARAGTFESITYDAVTGAISCTYVFGITVLVSFGFSYANTHDAEKSMQTAAIAGLETFGLSLAAQILASQIARTSFSNSLKQNTNFVVKKLKPKAIQAIIKGLRSLSGKKAIFGKTAQKALEKALRSNLLTEGVTFLVFSIPQTQRLIRRQMSKGQYVKTLTSVFSAMFGTTAAALMAGSATAKVGGKLGKKVNKNLGAGIGFAAGMVGGAVAGAGAAKVGNLIREDDAEILFRLFNAVVINTCIDNYLDEDEIEEFLTSLSKDKDIQKDIKKVMKVLYASSTQYQDLEDVFDQCIQRILSKRMVITKDIEPDMNSMSEVLGNVINDISKDVD